MKRRNEEQRDTASIERLCVCFVIDQPVGLAGQDVCMKALSLHECV